MEAWRMNSLLEKLEVLDLKQRWMICGLAVLLLAGIGYYLHSMNAEGLDALSVEVEDIRQSVQKYQAIATRLDELKTRLAALDEMLKVAITLLPETREIPDLLTQISQLGLNSGLEFRLFKPEPEKPTDFYAEVPVSLAIQGGFHDLGRFFSHLSQLTRIVNVTDIKISLAKGSGDPNALTTNCLLTTFRFLEPREADSNKGAKPAKP
jgi:type IV pilus assembly protein PilO